MDCRNLRLSKKGNRIKRTMKLLSPAGNFESLKMAVYNGADEVYLGINDFNARNNIDGFTLKTLKDAVDLAHIYGVKVCLAINVLFTDDELGSALDTVVEAYNIGVDAFIVQDLGLASLVAKLYSNVVLHASTQMAVHNLEGVRFLQRLNFKRVVLSRETPLKEIKRIRDNCDIEIEYFVHGALCVSFSGNCYMSSYLHFASGNRGRCKQLCRLPYTLFKGDKSIKKGYLLSAKDFDMTDRLSDLKDAGVDVLKIEGRARRPYYVAETTSHYRKVLDGFMDGKEGVNLAFNRGYTDGYFSGNGNIISDYQNHIGIKVGKVKKVENGKRFNRVFFSTDRQLSKKSAFKFFSGGIESAVVSAYDLDKITDREYVLTTTAKIKVGDSVNLISDAKREDEVLAKKLYRKINLSVAALKGEKISATYYLNKKAFSVYGNLLQSAVNQPLTEKDIKDNFAKNEYFEFVFDDIKTDGVFITKKDLNEFRRSVVDSIVDNLTKLPYEKIKPVKVEKTEDVKPLKDVCFVGNLAEKIKGKIAVYSPKNYNAIDIKEFVLKSKKAGAKPYLDTPNFALKEDIELLKDIVLETGIAVVANNLYALSLTDDYIIGGGLNVYNGHTAKVLGKPFITAEWDNGGKVDFPYMTLRHCPMKSHLNATCDSCPYSDDYAYKMDSGKVFRLDRKKLSTCTFYLIK